MHSGGAALLGLDSMCVCENQQQAGLDIVILVLQ